MEGNKGEKKWDNCNSIINKIYFRKNNEILPSTTWINLEGIVLSEISQRKTNAI